MSPKIHVSDLDTMSDMPVDITITGLQPFQWVTLHSFTTTDHNKTFECVAQYVADKQGCISLERDASIEGSFTGKEPMGLFWAMEESPMNVHKYMRFAKLNVTTPMVVTIRMYDAAIESLNEVHDLRVQERLQSLEIASVKLNRWYMAPGTKRITFTVKEHGIHGTLFIPAGEGPFPGVLTMFGGYPGTMEFKASLLASHGFAALALAFYGAPGLPKEPKDTDFYLSLDIMYFEKAVSVLSSHPSVHACLGIGLIGLSLSSFIALTMAECLENIRCVIWIGGFVYPYYVSLSYGKKLHSFEGVHLEKSTYYSKIPVLCYSRPVYDNFDESHEPKRNSVIKFYDRHDIAFMFIAGLEDSHVPAEFHINKAESYLKKSKHPDYQILRYPGAGHLIEPRYSLHNGISAIRGQNYIPVWGGRKIPHCKAQNESWMKQIDFLKRYICPSLQSKM